MHNDDDLSKTFHLQNDLDRMWVWCIINGNKILEIFWLRNDRVFSHDVWTETVWDSGIEEIGRFGGLNCVENCDFV